MLIAIGCKGHGNGKGGFRLGPLAIAYGCTATGNAGPGFEISDGSFVTNCLSSGNAGPGFNVTGHRDGSGTRFGEITALACAAGVVEGLRGGSVTKIGKLTVDSCAMGVVGTGFDIGEAHISRTDIAVWDGVHRNSGAPAAVIEALEKLSPRDQSKFLEIVNGLRSERKGTKAFAAFYNQLTGFAANHMQLLAPLLPTIKSWLGG